MPGVSGRILIAAILCGPLSACVVGDGVAHVVKLGSEIGRDPHDDDAAPPVTSPPVTLPPVSPPLVDDRAAPAVRPETPAPSPTMGVAPVASPIREETLAAPRAP